MTLLQMSLFGAALTLIVLLIRALTLRVLPKRTFLALWMVVVIRLLVPFGPVFHVNLPEIEFTRSSETMDEARWPAAAAPTVQPAENEAQKPRTQSTEGSHAASDRMDREAPRAAAGAETETARQKVFGKVWLAGMLVMLALFTGSYAAGYRKFRGALPVDHEASRRWRAEHPLRRKYEIRSFGGSDAPMTYGVLRPVIIAPGAPAWWNSDEAGYELEHEYIHIRRFDAAIKLLLALTLIVHWFNPAVWALYVIANRDMELSCDEAVLNRLGENKKQAYAGVLLTAEERRRRMPVLSVNFGAETTSERIVEIMKYRKKSALSAVLAAVMVLSLAACAATGAGKQGVKISGESVDVNDIALRSEGEASKIYVNDGMKLLIPLEYDELVTVDLPKDSDTLFTVTEKASAEAAKAQGLSNEDGFGWLMSIGAVDEDTLHEMLCGDMSGAQAFAKDANGTYYMYYHPTDVRFLRENMDELGDENSEDWQQWTALCGMAQTVKDAFIGENDGLTPVSFGNSTLEIDLARAAYDPNAHYTIGALEYGPVEPQGVDAAPYVERLTNGLTLELAELGETPDGEYVVLSFPDEDYRYDFFRNEEGGNYIRRTIGEHQELYRAVYADGTTKASEVMNEWYEACYTKNGTGDWPIDPPADTSKSEQTGTAGSNIPLKDNTEEAEYQIKVAMQYQLGKMFADKVNDARIYVEKVYTAEEEQAIEPLNTMKLGLDEVAFEVRYELHPSEGTDVNELTAATGVYDEESGWVKEKYNIGVLRPNPDGSEPAYIITNFGTGF